MIACHVMKNGGAAAVVLSFCDFILMCDARVKGNLDENSAITRSIFFNFNSCIFCGLKMFQFQT